MQEKKDPKHKTPSWVLERKTSTKSDQNNQEPQLPQSKITPTKTKSRKYPKHKSSERGKKGDHITSNKISNGNSTKEISKEETSIQIKIHLLQKSIKDRRKFIRDLEKKVAALGNKRRDEKYSEIEKEDFLNLINKYKKKIEKKKQKVERHKIQIKKLKKELSKKY